MARPARSPEIDRLDPAAGAAAEPAAPDVARPEQQPETATGAGSRPRKRRRFGIMFWLGTAWLVFVLFGAITASWLPIQPPNATNVDDKLEKPNFLGGEVPDLERGGSTDTGGGRRLPTLGADGRPIEEGASEAVEGEQGETHVLGADGLGRDILSRLLHGSRVSLIVGFAAVSMGLIFGGVLGLLSGFFRGPLERTIMSAVDIILAFPALVLLLALLAYVGQSLTVIALVIGFLSIPPYTRVARANTLSVANREFVLAARAMGAKSRRILFRELTPNVILPVAAFALVAVARIIVVEGSLAFLGLSVEQPTATWGSMIAEGKRHLRTAPHVAFIPSFVLFLTVLSLNFVGDSLRSLFDVKESGI